MTQLDAESSLVHLIFSMKESVGVLAEALSIFKVKIINSLSLKLFSFHFNLTQNNFYFCLCLFVCLLKQYNVNLSRIESRSSKRFENDYEFLVECPPGKNLDLAIEQLRPCTQYLQIISRDPEKSDGYSVDGTVPWFPRNIRDLDRFANHILSYGSELDADHPVSFRQRLLFCGKTTFSSSFSFSFFFSCFSFRTLSSVGVIFSSIYV